MRILMFIDSLGAGGAQRQFVGLASMLKEKGYIIKVIMYYNEPFYNYVLDENKIEYDCIKNAQRPLTRFFYVHKSINKFNPDFLISYLDTPCILSCLDKFIYRKKYKLLVSERNTTQKITLRDKIKFYLYKKADFIVPNAYSQGMFLTNNYPKLEQKITVIHNFVDVNYFYLKNNIVKNKVPRIVIVASIWASKNALGLIEALKILKDKGIICEFHWYGKVESAKDYLLKCESRIKALNLQNYIFLHDKTQNVREVYQQADFLCLPSFYEGTPNVICEAMSSGLPIICSNVCDNSNYVKESLNGTLFDPYDINDIANKISNIISISDDEYKKMSLKSREFAEKLLSKEKFIAKYISILNVL